MTEFNAAQSRSIQAPLAHLLINAAAGTGKTSTLAARIHHLQTRLQIPSHAIMAISFSRTARSRLLEKLREFCKEKKSGSPVPTYTFHGLAFRILRVASSFGETWLKPGFDIIDPFSAENQALYRQRNLLLQGLFQHLDRETSWMACLTAIEKLRQGSESMEPCSDPEALQDDLLLEVGVEQNSIVKLSSREVRIAWRKYMGFFNQFNLIDFSGMIAEASRILSNSSNETRQRICSGLKAIVVDEYQDTSRAQESLLFALAGNDIPITVVGDIDQTIYAFNGSNVSNMDNFLAKASRTNVPVMPGIGMTENYRSAAPILNLANRIRNNLPFERKLVPADPIVNESIVAYRRKNLPVKLVHATKLELAADFVAREIDKLMNEEKIGDIAVLVRKNSEHSPQAKTVVQALEQRGIKLDPGTLQSQKDRIRHLRFLFDLCNDAKYYGEPLECLMTEKSDIVLPPDMTTDQFDACINEALNSGAVYCYETADYLFEVMNVDEKPDGTDHEQPLKIGTIHSAKGEEFRVVFLLYLGDRSFPHGNKPDIEEERRLLYVGITRAQERLYVIGRPGIHSEDFFGKCTGDNTEYMEYFVPGGTAAPISNLRLEKDISDAIDQARSRQRSKEQEEREKLWALFEDDYL